MAELITVQVCYASPLQQFLRALQLAPGATVRDAITESGVLAAQPQLDLATLAVGIYGKKQTLDTLLRQHDRVELYRPLLADPKQARRRRKAAAP